MICPRCKGEGQVRYHIDWLCGLFTLGLTILADLNSFKECNLCNGKGLIEHPELLSKEVKDG